MAKQTATVTVSQADWDAKYGATTELKFESTDETKLAGIEENATTDQTGAEVRDAIVALSDTERQIVVSEPQTGEFKVIGVHRNAAGDLEYDYDDVAA